MMDRILYSVHSIVNVNTCTVQKNDGPHSAGVGETKMTEKMTDEDAQMKWILWPISCVGACCLNFRGRWSTNDELSTATGGAVQLKIDANNREGAKGVLI